MEEVAIRRRVFEMVERGRKLTKVSFDDERQPRVVFFFFGDEFQVHSVEGP